ncbi:MAG TPA: hybrid sensor histidine kinase/response regulator [Cyanobacteria bacterium UBA8803]|nr:hybrid sensor histidine kinase/response regulator [Cyanobacteria bacterium UBA9273]HBL60848.1 hybrid sensor histidine kinase/response regulator [Cyanobacteria bacterium UBA8803]
MEERLKILVVDDDEVDRMTVCCALKAAGVKIWWSEASDYATAMATLQNETFDCVFLDYRLPDKDGLTLVNELREAGVQVPLVVLTAQGDEQIALELMKAGASDYLAKNRVSPQNLARSLHNAIRIYRAEMLVTLANQQLRQTNERLIQQNQKLKKQQQQIQLQNLQLLEASRLKSEFLATISHELRTPLNAIMGFSQMLLLQRHGLLNQKQLEMLQRIFNNGKNLLALMNDLLDFGKIEAGRLELKPEKFNFAELVVVTTEELRPLTAGKPLSLQVNLALQNPYLVNDKSRLRQVLVNLLSNAIKFTEAGTVEVKVWEMERERVVLAIRDTGIGISEAQLKHIFEAFRQVDQTTTREYSGTGLGLAITDSLVRMMQGSIKVESQVGEGSVFQVELPRQLPSLKEVTVED